MKYYIYTLKIMIKFLITILKGEFKLVCNNIQNCKYIMTSMIDNRTFNSWSNCLRDAISNSKDEGYDFNHIAEIDIITLAHKCDKIYVFYLKHNMPAFEWELNATINKNKSWIIKFPRDWRHPLNKNFESYRV